MARFCKSALSRGSYIIEFAAVMPILLFLVLGAFDINTLLQGYTAIQEGAKTSLRCLYPTDGRCTNISADTRVRLFDVTIQDRDYQYFGQVNDYRGEASWFSLPINRYSGAQAQVIVSVSYDAEQASYSAIWQAPPDGISQAGKVPYIIQTYTLPYVSGDALDPNFGTASSGANRNNYPAQGIVGNASNSSISNVRGSTSKQFSDPDEGIVIGRSATYTIANTFQNLPCFLASNLDMPLDKIYTSGFKKRCDNQKAPILFSISGKAGVAPLGVKGKVLISLVVDGKTVRTLGGRIFTMGDSSSNFAPRGLLFDKNSKTFSRVSEDTANQYLKESQVDGNIEVPYDKPFYLEFKLQSLDGQQVSWTGNQIKIFTSTFETRNDDANCINKIPLEEAAARISCASDHPSGLPAINLVNTTYIPENQNMPRKLPCGTTNENYQSELLKMSIPDTANFKLVQDTTSICPIVRRTQTCLENCGAENISSTCSSICPIKDTELDALGIKPKNILCNETNKNLDAAAFTYQVPDCLHREPQKSDLPANLNCYAKLSFASVKEVGRYPLYTKQIDASQKPTMLKASMPKFSCDLVRVENHIYDDIENTIANSKLSNDSPFLGAKADLGCDWQETLRQAAIQEEAKENKLDPDAYFLTSYKTVGETKIAAKPKNNCSAYRQKVKSILHEEHKGVFAESEIPKLCKSADSPCEVKFTGYSAGATAATSQDFHKAAHEFGQEEILAAFPRARFEGAECKQAYCSNIQISKEDSQDLIHAKVSLHVPLMLLRPFGKDSIELSYHAEERLEKSFAK